MSATTKAKMNQFKLGALDATVKINYFRIRPERAREFLLGR